MEVKAEGNAQIPLTRIDQVGLRSLLKTWERRAGKKKIAGEGYFMLNNWRVMRKSRI